MPQEPLTKTHLMTLVLKQYNHGKFSDLVTSVIALPSVLFTACQNLTTPHTNSAPNLTASSCLIHSVSIRISIEEMGQELCENRFDVGACCITILPSRKKGEPLVLPNLKLKVLIEAIRMVLEVAYDEWFVTFAYGGYVGMGRHRL